MRKDAMIPKIVLGIISALAVIVSIRLLHRLPENKERDSKMSRICGRATYFLDDSESEKTCSICLGRIGISEIILCKCNRVSHRDCVSLMDICPYCGRPYRMHTARMSRTARCPVCGREVTCSLCECGTVLPKADGSILCSCGNKFDGRRIICDRCGTIYGKDTIERPPESISIKTKN